MLVMWCILSKLCAIEYAPQLHSFGKKCVMLQVYGSQVSCVHLCLLLICIHSERVHLAKVLMNKKSKNAMRRVSWCMCLTLSQGCLLPLESQVWNMTILAK